MLVELQSIYGSVISLSAKDLQLKSSTVQGAVIALINKFMDVLDVPEFQQNKYNWLDKEAALKPVSSGSKFIVSGDAGMISTKFLKFTNST